MSANAPSTSAYPCEWPAEITETINAEALLLAQEKDVQDFLTIRSEDEAIPAAFERRFFNLRVKLHEAGRKIGLVSKEISEGNIIGIAVMFDEALKDKLLGFGVSAANVDPKKVKILDALIDGAFKTGVKEGMAEARQLAKKAEAVAELGDAWFKLEVPKPVEDKK
ncbi:MAG: hypothetical protein WCT36_05030 [Candidatus Gracilibacteria bacterium]|jgi:hypothetical protein